MGNKPDRQGGRDRRIGFPEVMAVSGKEGWLARASRMLDLPGDGVAGLPRIELIGSGELRMEGHRGILAYGPEEIHIAAAYTGSREDAQEWLEELQEAFPGYPIHADPLSLSVACHIGPGALAITLTKVLKP